MKKLLYIFILLQVTSLNLKAQVWEVIGEMPNPVYGGEAVVKDSLIYIIGGYSNILNSNVNIIQEYNPQNNTWRIVDSINTPRYALIAGRYQDSIVLAGGISLSSLFDSSIEMWNLNDPPYIYDVSLDFIRTYSTGLIYNDIFYGFGGTSVSLLSKYMFEYKIPESTIIFQSNFDFLVTYPFQQMSSMSGSSIFLFGGIFIGTSRAIYRYDTANRTMELLPVELIKSRAGGRAVFMSDSLIFIIGGLNETEPSISGTEIFSIDNENYSLSVGPSLNFSRSELMAVKYNNSIFVFGGKNGSEPVAQYEKLDYITNVEENYPTSISEFILYPNYPNPFNPSTQISFYISSESYVKVKIYNIAGEEIKELINDILPQGTHRVIFNGHDKNQSQLSSGIYFYKLLVFNFAAQKTNIDTRKMLLLK